MKYAKLKKKIQGGKLLEINLKYDNNKITTISITGDFFMYPESSIEDLENFLVQKKISKGLEKEIETFLKSRDIEILGFSSADLTNIIIEGFELNNV